MEPRVQPLQEPAGLDRRAIRKRQIASGTTKAKELGYYAQQTIQENQMSGEEYYTLLQIVEAEADRWRCDEQDDGSRSRFEPREGFSFSRYDPGSRMAG